MKTLLETDRIVFVDSELPLWHDLLAEAQTTMWTWDGQPEGDVAITGWISNELKKSNLSWVDWLQLIHEDDRESFEGVARETLIRRSGRQPSEIRFQIQGGEQMLSLTGRLLSSSDPGMVQAVFSISRKSESDEKFLSVVEDLNEMICRWTPDGTRTFVNSAYARHFGEECADMVGVSFMDFLSEAEKEELHERLEGLSPESPYEIHERAVTSPRGNQEWHQWTNRGFFDSEGNLREVQSVGRDITDFRESELRMSEIARGLVSIDSSDFEASLSSYVQRMLAADWVVFLPKGDEGNRFFSAAFCGIDQDQVDRFDERNEISDSLKGEELLVQETRACAEFSEQSLFGELGVESFAARAIAVGEDSARGLLGLIWVGFAKPLISNSHVRPVIDLCGAAISAEFQRRAEAAARKEAENQLRQAQKMEAVGTLAGGLAHDFNNLLTGVLGNLSVIRVTPESTIAEVSEFLVNAEEATQRASELVQQLLGLSRRTKLQLAPCDPNAVIQKLYSLLRHAFDAQIQIRVDLADDISAIRSDHTQLEQVLLNLCVNARDAMNGPGTITVRSQYCGEWVEISVEDDGPGMPDELKSRIFEPFFTTKEEGRGTGLGLAMCYAIMEKHEGEIVCDSEPGRGTKFTLRFPRLNESAAQGDPMIVDVETPALASEHAGGKVLIIDDELLIRTVARGLLKKGGYEVLEASTGEEGIKKAVEESEDLSCILLDLTMPVMNGREVLAKLEVCCPHIPVLICSGYNISPEEIESDCGVRPDGTVQKPFDLNSLLSSVQQVVSAAAETAK